MKRLFHEIADLLRRGENLVSATIFRKTGSAPRSAGAKMVVRPDGSIFGTIGGGRLEADIIRLAEEALRSRASLLQPFSLTGEDVADMDMICGGQGEVLLDFIDCGDESNRVVYEEAATLCGRREKAWLITKLGGPQVRQQCLVGRSGTLVGAFDADPEFLARLAAWPARTTVHAEVLAGYRLFAEPIGMTGTVYIFGAGHVAQSTAPLCDRVGFRTVVLDDRPDFASRDKFPVAVEIGLVESFERLPALEIDEDSYLVIVTRGHLHDKTVLEYALRTKAGYIGMIGSRRKRDMIFQALAAAGFGKRDFDRVHCPIGTDIAAETPEELAVSIVGELIKARAGRERWQPHRT